MSGSAQSGRKKQPTRNPSSAGAQAAAEKEKEKEKEEQNEKKAADKPLIDTSPTAVGDDGTIKLDTSLVTIPASVIETDGTPVPNLKKRDFKIYEDSVEQNIEALQTIEVPFHVVLLLDTSASARFKLEQIQSAAYAFVKELRWDDKVMVVSFDNDVEIWTDFTTDREELRKAIYKTRTGGSTKLYEAVDLSLAEFLKPIKGRKAVVLFTDGVDTSSRRSSYRKSIERAEESEALVFCIRYNTELDNNTQGQRPTSPFPIPGGGGGRGRRFPLKMERFVNYQFPGQGPRGPLPTPGGVEDYRLGEQYLKDLTDKTGGRLYQADTTADLEDAFSKIANDLRFQYAVSYYPSNGTRDGSYRRIKITVNKPDVIVRAREGYRATMETVATENGKEKGKRPGF
ncbi:MAG TPA: VWA domain-containing protein, partial [Blastocatellia bacterium]|nr:VWA domain-containing protein [Blastocatellia bacterium]